MAPASRAALLLALVLGTAACGRPGATVETGAGAAAAPPGPAAPPSALAGAADELDCDGPLVGTTRQHAAPAPGARRPAEAAVAERLGPDHPAARALAGPAARRVAVEEEGRTVLVLGLEELAPGYFVVAEEVACDR